MIYSDTITIPPMTPENAPAEIVIRPGAGYLVNAQVIFLAGALGTIGIRLMDENRQFAPLPNGWLKDSATWAENRKLQGPPYRIVIQGISTALDWPHSVRIRLEIIKR